MERAGRRAGVVGLEGSKAAVQALERVARRRQAKAPTRARAERIVEGSGAGVADVVWSAAEGGFGGSGGKVSWMAVVVELEQVQGGGGGVQEADVVWCQFCTVGLVDGVGVRVWAAGVLTVGWTVAVGVGMAVAVGVTVVVGVGACGIVFSCQSFRNA